MELFEQALLNKANDLLAAKRLDEAFDYFRFLEDRYPDLPGLAAASENCLFEQAKAFYAKQQYRNALGILRELHGRNPQRPKLDAAMGAVRRNSSNNTPRSTTIRPSARCFANWRLAFPIIR